MASIVRDKVMDRFVKNQLLQILDDWTETLESGGRIDVVLYTDFEKAFDKVPHK